MPICRRISANQAIFDGWAGIQSAIDASAIVVAPITINFTVINVRIGMLAMDTTAIPTVGKILIYVTIIDSWA